MKQKLRLGDCYALTKHKRKQYTIRYISLLAVLTSMCLYTVKQVSAQQAEPAATAVADTTKSVRDTIAMEEVIINTGYERISPERMTGSYVSIDNKLLNRKISPDILERLDGVTNGLIFNKTASSYDGGREPAISIRGRSTIFANAEPMIILDNFPYVGDIRNINPNDVESITVLKDAAAASVWGVRSGNGVIVISTKSGRESKVPETSFSANITVGEQPDLYYTPRLTSAQFIDVEKFLFDQGVYNRRIATGYQAVSPAVTIFAQIRDGQLTKAEGDLKLERLRNTDVRRQLDEYYYRPAFNQQYNFNVSGGTSVANYFFSAGFDRNQGSDVGNARDRITLTAKNSYTLWDRLTLSSHILFSSANQHSSSSFRPNFPYDRLVDDAGNPLALPGTVLSPSFLDTAGGGLLLDWRHIPLEERSLHTAKNELTDYRINLGADYTLLPSLELKVQYQYGRGMSNDIDNADEKSYYTRNLVNSFTQFEGGNSISRPIPTGDIRRIGQNNYTSHFGRAQLSYEKKWNEHHHLTAFTAFEINSTASETNARRLYGYDPETGTFATVDFLTRFSQFPSGSARIENASYESWLTDRFRSYIGNLSYDYAQKYILFASFRRDESNIFGVKTNQKGTPLWSAGLAWVISNEPFLANNPIINNLRVRATLGKQGNIDKSVSAFVTARNEPLIGIGGEPTATILNPPNPSLSWEQLATTNIGVEFGLFNKINGVVEVYRKRGNDLIGNSPIAPQTGLTSFRGNVANMVTRGMDVTLNAGASMGSVSWSGDLIYSFVRDKITDYKVPQSSNLDYMRSNYVNPFEGKPFSALFSFPYAGLDEQGDPLGYLDGKMSNDYTAIVNNLGLDAMVYHGPQVPVHFGGLRNSISYRNISFSFNVTYKLGYFFRRQGLSGSTLYSGSNPPTGYLVRDYETRWKQPGDETHTATPRLIYPVNSARESLYTYGSVLVEQADHIRLQDIQLSYELRSRNRQHWLKNVRINAYVANLGVLWRANNEGIDPDVHQSAIFPTPMTFSLGINANFN